MNLPSRLAILEQSFTELSIRFFPEGSRTTLRTSALALLDDADLSGRPDIADGVLPILLSLGDCPSYVLDRLGRQILSRGPSVHDGILLARLLLVHLDRGSRLALSEREVSILREAIRQLCPGQPLAVALLKENSRALAFLGEDARGSLV
jgi:hypothetical protein